MDIGLSRNRWKIKLTSEWASEHPFLWKNMMQWAKLFIFDVQYAYINFTNMQTYKEVFGNRNYCRVPIIQQILHAREAILSAILWHTKCNTNFSKFSMLAKYVQ